MMDKLPKQAAHDEKNARRGYSLLLSGFCGLWCGLEGRLPQEAARVDGLAMDPHLEVEVRSGSPAGHANVSDHLALLDVLAGRYAHSAQVSVVGRDPTAVVESDLVAVAVLRRVGPQDHAVGRSGDRGSQGRIDVQALVELLADRTAERPLYSASLTARRDCGNGGDARARPGPRSLLPGVGPAGELGQEHLAEKDLSNNNLNRPHCVPYPVTGLGSSPCYWWRFANCTWPARRLTKCPSVLSD